MTNPWMLMFLFCLGGAFAGCANSYGDEELKSGEVTRVAFTGSGKNLVVANEFRHFANTPKREKCHSRLRSFSTSDWKLAADTGELSLSDMEFARSTDGSWVVKGQILDRIGRGNPFNKGAAFYKLEPATLEREHIDGVQQEHDNWQFSCSAIACADNKPLCAVHLLRNNAFQRAFLFDLKAEKKTVELQDFPTAFHDRSNDRAMHTLLEFQPDAKHIVSCHPCKPFQIQLHATETGKLVTALKTESPVGAMSFSPNGKMLAGLCWNGTVLILESKVLKQIHILKVQKDQGSPYALAFVGNGHLAVLSSYTNIELFDTKEWKSIRTFEGKKDRVNCLAASPDGKLLAAGFGATGHSPGFVRVWEPATGKLVVELK